MMDYKLLTQTSIAQLTDDAATTAKKYAAQKGGTVVSSPSDAPVPVVSIQAKLVLLTIAFPRLRILWSSSPHESAVLFTGLKKNHNEPDPSRASAIGTEDIFGLNKTITENAESNIIAEEVLQTMPGVSSGNAIYIMQRIENIRSLCEMNLEEVQEIFGAEPGRACWKFVHENSRL